MPITIRREALALFLGDIAFLVLSLWVTLLVRTSAFPTYEIFYAHIKPFTFLFLLSALVFLIAGLYEKHTLLFKSSLPQTIFYAQMSNIVVGAIFFFLIPYFGIQPKTNLFIYLFFSTTFVSLWRVSLFPLLRRGVPTRAMLIGDGDECRKMHQEINGNSRYAIRFVTDVISGAHGLQNQRDLIEKIKINKISVVVLPFAFAHDMKQDPAWDALMISGIRFIDSASLFEELFDCVSLSLLDHRWFLEESVRTRTAMYAILKRIMDVILSAVALVVLAPFVFIVASVLMVIDGGGPFIFQKRVGRGGRDIAIVKFRTMLFDDGGVPEKQKLNHITPFGAFLRKTRIDEVPQFWNVLVGDLSLIGPRPEIRTLADKYEEIIPFYNARLLMQPGLSGWAQIKHASPPKFQLDVEATREKLSFDMYYLKHRSFIIDISVALRTMKILVSWAGR